MADSNAANIENRLRALIRDEYGLERMKGVPAGTVISIFKEWGKIKELSIQQIYQKTGKNLSVTKVPAKKEYAPLVVSKKRQGFGRVLGSNRIGVIFAPIDGKEVLAFAFKGCESDFEKIGTALGVGNIKLVRVDEEEREAAALDCDKVYYTICNILKRWGYLVKAIDTRKIRGIVTELRANEKGGVESKTKGMPVYSHYHSALLVSVKERGSYFFSAERKVCILLIPRMVEMHESSVDIIEFEGSWAKKVKALLLGKMPGLPCSIKFVVRSAPKNLKLPE